MVPKVINLLRTEAYYLQTTETKICKISVDAWHKERQAKIGSALLKLRG